MVMTAFALARVGRAYGDRTGRPAFPRYLRFGKAIDSENGETASLLRNPVNKPGGSQVMRKKATDPGDGEEVERLLGRVAGGEAEALEKLIDSVRPFMRRVI